MTDIEKYLPVARAPRVIDATLRESMQAPGVRLDTESSVEIAKALVQLGVDMLECGHPAVSEAEMKRVSAVCAAVGSSVSARSGVH